jgi:hypothetical protein
MKIRNGFVSNSSSSSFVLITPKDEDPSVIFARRYADIFGDSPLARSFEAYISNTFENIVYNAEKITCEEDLKNWFLSKKEKKDILQAAKNNEVHIIDIPDCGEGGTGIEAGLRYFFKDNVNYNFDDFKMKLL